MSVSVVGAPVVVTSDAEALGTLEALPPDSVLVVPTPAGSALSRSLRRARLVLDRRDVALAEVEGPVSRVVGAVRLVAPLEAAPGAVGGLVRAAVAQHVSVAVVDSPARLRTPAPSVGQHAIAWWPSAGWVADLDAGTVRRRAKGASVRLRGATSAVVYASSERARPWAAELAEAAGPQTDVTQLPEASVPGDGFWGVRSWAEISYVRSPAADVLAHVVAAVTTLSCAGCDREVAGSDCPFCGVATGAGPEHDARIQEDAQ